MATAKQWNRACLRWREKLGLRNWECITEVVDEELASRDDGWWEGLARCDARPRYMTMKLTINGAALRQMSLAEIDDVACHEILHAVIEPLKGVAEHLLALLPESRRGGYVDWLVRENEGVTEHMKMVIQSYQKALDKAAR